MTQQHENSRLVSDFSIKRILSIDDSKLRESTKIINNDKNQTMINDVSSSSTNSEISKSGKLNSEFCKMRMKNFNDSFSIENNYCNRDEKIFESSLIDDKFDKSDEKINEWKNEISTKLKNVIGDDNSDTSKRFLNNGVELSWLNCTRYRPPKLPRKSLIGKNSKRRPGTHPRIPFTANQLQILEDKYRGTPYLSRRDVVHLSTFLRLPQSRVKIWFQNRRARDRRESTVTMSDNATLTNVATSIDTTKPTKAITLNPILNSHS